MVCKHSLTYGHRAENTGHVYRNHCVYIYKTIPFKEKVSVFSLFYCNSVVKGTHLEITTWVYIPILHVTNLGPVADLTVLPHKVIVIIEGDKKKCFAPKYSKDFICYY